MTAALLSPVGHPRTGTPTRAPADRAGARILVVFASRHGATREIAAALARELSRTEAARHGVLSVRLAPAQQRPDPAGFSGVVLGSAVYGGRWLGPAVDYAHATAATLRARATWLFSSGLPTSGGTPRIDDAGCVRAAIGSRGHRFFPGRLEHRLLSAAERGILTGAPALVGDHRDWPAVRAWAEEIASETMASHAVALGHGAG